jgi:cytochrome bd-type quinol oxidase subunit 1
MSNLKKDFDIEKQVSATIAGFSVDKAEDLIYKSAKKQWIKLQLLGAAIGVLTGLILIFLQTQLFT